MNWQPTVFRRRQHGVLLAGLIVTGTAAGSSWQPFCLEAQSCFQPQFVATGTGDFFDKPAYLGTLPLLGDKRLWLSHQLSTSPSLFGIWSVELPALTPAIAPAPDTGANPSVFANTKPTSNNDLNMVQAPDGSLLVMGLTLSRYPADGSAPETIDWAHLRGSTLGVTGLIGPPVVVQGVVYAGIAGFGGSSILRSTDSGRTWFLSSGTARFEAGSYALSSDRTGNWLWGITQDQISGNMSLRESRDQGTTWQRVDDGSFPAQTVRLVLDPAADQDVYALTLGGLYVSRNAGLSWTVLLAGPTVTSLTFVPAGGNSRQLLMGTSEGIIASDDGGASWTSFAAGLPFAPHAVGNFGGLLVATNASGYFICPDADCAGDPVPVEVASGSTLTVIEFHNTDLDHYFVTASETEARGIDAGSAGPGWRRTGKIFRVWPVATQPGTVPACRFYGSVSPGPNSHFFTTSTSECGRLFGLQASTPASQPRWNFEHYAFATMPATPGTNGTCPTGSVPVWRAYNNGFGHGKDSNHRFATDHNLISAVVASGWIDEGVVFCAAP